MTDRIGWRLFGLIYAHPQPKSPDTTTIRNRAGQPLPTDFDGRVAEAFLISEKEVAQRRETLQAVCRSCHGRSWVTGHFARHQAVIAETNASVRAATEIMERIWKDGLALGARRRRQPL